MLCPPWLCNRGVRKFWYDMNEKPFMNLMIQMPAIQTQMKVTADRQERLGAVAVRGAGAAGLSANNPSRANSRMAMKMSTADTAATANHTERQPKVPVSSGMIAAETNTPYVVPLEMMPSAVPRRPSSMSRGTISTMGTYTEADVPAATPRQIVSITVEWVSPTPIRQAVARVADPITTMAPLKRWASQVAANANTMNSA